MSKLVMHWPLRLALALALLLVLVVASCGGSTDSRLEAGSAEQAALAPTPGVFGSLPPLPTGGRQASQTALIMDGSDSFEAYSGALVSGSRLVIDGSNAPSMGLAWAMYEFTTTETAKFPVSLRVSVGDDSAEYWLAISDYSRKTWRFSGPYSGIGSLAAPLDADLVSPTGRSYAVVLSHNPQADSRVVVEELELKLSENPPPAPPTALQAGVLPGSVMLTWNASNAVGLLGYNVYYSTENFNNPNQNLVTRANDALVPVAGSPQYEVLELDQNKTYYFKVAAVVGDQVESQLSNAATAVTTYTLLVNELFPPRQYPGFWVYARGSGFNPAPGGTKVYWKGLELSASEVQDVSATGLRFRVPLSAPVEEINEVKVKVGGQFSNVFQEITVHPATPPKNWAHVGKTLYQSFEMYDPAGVATDSAGNLYVGQSGVGRISVYKPDGYPIHEFWFDSPGDLEIMGDGRILAKHGGGSELYFIDQATGVMTEAIDPTEVDAHFNDGWFFAATSGGNTVYLSDAGAGMIRKFVNGAYVSDIGATQLEHPQDIELDAAGNLVVADDSADGVFWFDTDGNYLGSYDGSANLDPDDGELRGPTGLAIQSDGSVMVADRERDRVLRLNGVTRAFLGEWGRSGYGDGLSKNLPDPLGQEGRFWSMWGIAPLAGGKVLVADEYDCRSGVYDQNNGHLAFGLMDYVCPEGEFVQPQSFAVRESDGAFAVLDGSTYSVTIMDRKNNVLDYAYLETGIDGDVLTGRLDRTPSDICWSGDKLYLTHDYTKLTEFSSDFDTYRVLAVDWGDEPGQFKGNNGMASDGTTLYVGDRDNDRVQVFVNGNYQRSIAMPDPANNNIESLAIDRVHGTMFVLDNPWNDSSKVLRFNATTGAYLDSLNFGFGVGGVLACDPAGYVYVYYWGGEGLLHKYHPPTSTGGQWDFVCDLAPYGDGDGNVRNIYGVNITPDGRYLIGDRDRRQVVILTP